LRVVETHAVSGAGAAVVAGGEELAVAEILHDFDLVLRHRAERIVDVVLAAVFGSDAVAVTPQIRRDDVKTLGEAPCDLAPGDMGEWIAVQQQQWRGLAAPPPICWVAAGCDFSPRVR